MQFFLLNDRFTMPVPRKYETINILVILIYSNFSSTKFAHYAQDALSRDIYIILIIDKVKGLSTINEIKVKR